MKRVTSPREKRMEELQQNRYLSGLSNTILDCLVQNTHLISFEVEECIIREGQPCQGLYIVEFGRVKIFSVSPSGREMIFNVLEEGESFNEVPVFDQLENPVNVGAVLKTQTWLIDAEALRKIIEDHPEASRQIIINLSQNLRLLVDKIADLSFYKVTVRLSRLLRQLPRSQLSGSGQERLTQDNLASRIGTVREVVARSLKELEKYGAIEVQRGKISIISPEKLIDWD
ncbi:MAG: Crp/Fnr family transcriptional regulator [Anaerolineales bacterium]|nr:Crp/Fnr family transcriptional regulator [Anaerolineales bacterium]